MGFRNNWFVVPAYKRKSDMFNYWTDIFGAALALAAATLNAEAGISCKKEEALCVGTVMMFMRSFGQFISPVLFTEIGTAFAIENRRLPYIGSLVMCVSMLMIYFVLFNRFTKKSV